MSTHIDAARVAEEKARARGEKAGGWSIAGGNGRRVRPLGVLYASKRPDLLLRVVASLRDRDVRARLLVCGDFLWDKPHDRAAFLDLARELGVAEWLDFRGRIDDQGELLGDHERVRRLPVALHRWLVTRAAAASRRSAELAIPLVTTEPERPDGFDLIPG